MPSSQCSPLRRIALLHVRLTVLDDGAFAKRGLGAVEHPARDVHHRRLEVRERKIRIQLHRPGHRLETFVGPGRVRQAELVAPVARFERHGAARGGQRLDRTAGADEQEGERGVRFGQVALELDRPAHVIDRAREQRPVGLIARARHLVLEEPRVAEADVGGGVARIEDHGALEVRDGAGHHRRVERFQPDAAFGERLIRLEAARFAIDPALRRARPAGAECVGELADDAVLEVEDLVERTVGLGVREALAALCVDYPRGDAQAVAGALEAADHRAIDGEHAAKRRELAAGLGDGLGDAKAIDDAHRRGAQIVGQGLGDAGRQPGERGIAADVLEVEHRDRRQPAVPPDPERERRRPRRPRRSVQRAR